MDRSIVLNIAGVKIEIISGSTKMVPGIAKSWSKFVTNEKPDWSITVAMKKNLKGILPAADSATVWNENRFQFRQKIFFVDGDVRRKRISVAATYRVGWGPAIRGTVNLLFIYLGGFLLHGAAFLNEEGARIYFGPSGRGKSTLSKIALKHGAVLLTDESVAVLPRGNGYWASATPFYGELTHVTKNTGGPLRSAALISHGKENKLARLSPKDFAVALMSEVFPFPNNKCAVERLFDTIKNVLACVEGYSLSFVPDTSIWNYLNGYFSRNTQTSSRYSLAGHR